MPVNDVTTNRSYQKPNSANTLLDDVERLRSALDAIDTDMASKAPTAGPTFTGVTTVGAGSAGAPALTFTGATSDTGLYSPSADQLAISTGGTERARIDSSGRLLVGTSSARSNVNLQSGDRTPHVQIETSTNTYSNGLSIINNSADGYAPQLTLGLSLANGIGSNGNVAPVNPAAIGMLNFVGNDGDQFLTGARIEAVTDAATSNNDMPCRLVFSTTADGASSPTERMRIDSAGLITAGSGGINGMQALLLNSGQVNTSGALLTLRTTNDLNGGYFQAMRNAANTIIGTISESGTTAVAYNTTSDYRLKENVIPVADGITRLKQLNPSRFNFISDPDRTVDGFIAHEVQAVVPEAITGEKDAKDDDGNPIYQGIDQSKLVPLLTAALQEAIAKIETLEAKVAAFEAA